MYSLLIQLFLLFLPLQNAELNLQYKVRQPAVASAKPPLLILLHGVGSNEEDLFSFAKSLPGKYLIVSARAPLTLSKGSYAWYHIDFSNGKPKYSFNEEKTSRNEIVKFIKALKGKFNYDEKNVYLCGFSQGAIMSYSVALTHPEIVKGIAVMSGRMLEETDPEIRPYDEIKHLRIFISHGINDNVLGINYARTAKDNLTKLKLIPSYHEYPATHQITQEMFNDLYNWLK